MDLVEPCAGDFRRHIESGASHGRLSLRLRTRKKTVAVLPVRNRTASTSGSNFQSRPGATLASNATRRIRWPSAVGVGLHDLRRALVAGGAAEGGVEWRCAVGEPDHRHRERQAADAINRCCAPHGPRPRPWFRRGRPEQSRHAPVPRDRRRMRHPRRRKCGAASRRCGTGAGDGTVHSSVVAPGPHGLAGAARLAVNAS